MITLHVAWLVVIFFFGGCSALVVVGLLAIAAREADAEERREMERELGVSDWLSPAQLKRLTGKVRFKAQCRVLLERGIPFKPSATGEPLVRDDYDVDAPSKPAHSRGPKWDRIAPA